MYGSVRLFYDVTTDFFLELRHYKDSSDCIYLNGLTEIQKKIIH